MKDELNVDELVEPIMSPEDEAMFLREAEELRAENEERRRLGKKPGLLDLNEARIYSGRSKCVIVMAIGTGELKAIKSIGKWNGRWKFEKQNLDVWMGKTNEEE
jgi:hypothetical protein